jgi:hypothetical protein
MVNTNEQAIEIIQSTITQIAGLESFVDKLEVIDKLLDIEWLLSENEVSDTDLPEELQGNREAPWSD